MKFNSQICTTKEQSERLLALGLKRETADMYLLIDHFGNYLPATLCDFMFSKDQTNPAWSLHRLIEMYHKTCIFWTDCGDNPYEAMVCRIANKIRRGEFNNEYLEERV
jgi:hypothetical protein